MSKLGRGRMGLNALAAALQMLVQTGTGLLIYGYMIRQLGAQEVGGWVAVMALGMFACISDLGLREALVRRVALASAGEDRDVLRSIITTTILSVALFMSIALAITLLPWPWTRAALGQSAVWLGDYAWPIAAIVWLQRVSDCVAAALEGLQHFVLVACNNAVAALCGLLVGFWLIPTIGILGAAIGMTTQFGTLLLLNFIGLRLCVRGGLRGTGPLWSWALLKGSLNYGISVQGMAVAVLLTETLSKLLLARAGATALLSYFDFAFRVGRGLRGLLVAGNRVMVPKIAANEASSIDHGQLYRISFALLAAVSLPAFGLAIANARIIMTTLSGHVDTDAQWVFIFMMAAWLVFSLMDPALNVSLGTGRLKGPLIGHLLMPILTLFAGLWGEAHFGPLGLIAGTSLAIALGSMLIVALHHRRSRIPLNALHPFSILFAVGCVALGAWLGLQVSEDLQEATVPLYHAAALTFAASLVPILIGSLILFSRLLVWWKTTGRLSQPATDNLTPHTALADESHA